MATLNKHAGNNYKRVVALKINEESWCTYNILLHKWIILFRNEYILKILFCNNCLTTQSKRSYINEICNLSMYLVIFLL